MGETRFTKDKRVAKTVAGLLIEEGVTVIVTFTPFSEWIGVRVVGDNPTECKKLVAAWQLVALLGPEGGK